MRRLQELKVCGLRVSVDEDDGADGRSLRIVKRRSRRPARLTMMLRSICGRSGQSDAAFHFACSARPTPAKNQAGQEEHEEDQRNLRGEHYAVRQVQQRRGVHKLGERERQVGEVAASR